MILYAVIISFCLSLAQFLECCRCVPVTLALPSPLMFSISKVSTHQFLASLVLHCGITLSKLNWLNLWKQLLIMCTNAALKQTVKYRKLCCHFFLCQVTWSLDVTQWRCQSSTETSSQKPSMAASSAIWSTVPTTICRDRTTVLGIAISSCVLVFLCALTCFLICKRPGTFFTRPSS